MIPGIEGDKNEGAYERTKALFTERTVGVLMNFDLSAKFSRLEMKNQRENRLAITTLSISISEGSF